MVGEDVPWRDAMAQALYGAGGFFTRTDRPGGGGGDFRTSVHASPLFATAVLRLMVAVDEALGHPDPFDLVDIGAGGAQLLQHLGELVPTCLRRRLRRAAVELGPRPDDLAALVDWRRELPPAGTLTGLVTATEWLDNVPLDIAETDQTGVLRYVQVNPATGAETLGAPLTPDDAGWVRQWWAHRPPHRGVRVELGRPRDEAWAAAVAALARGLALAVDYGHVRHDRPHQGTLTGFRAGRAAAAVPDGWHDLTAHVAIDAVRRSGERAAGRRGVLVIQREALAALGLGGTRPPLELAGRDPAGYVRALAQATQAAELMDAAGLGGHYWVVQPVGISMAGLPAGLRQRAGARHMTR
jgi:SAM-dependent MidA family methyltransferase